jgi:uncharacterized Zn-finger protein
MWYTLWTFWIKHNDKVFNHEPWHESKVKHLVWDDLVIYTKATWERVVKQVKISIFCVGVPFYKGHPRGFDQMWGAGNVLCRRDNT